MSQVCCVHLILHLGDSDKSESSQDIFQRKLDEILRDIINVAGIADEILVFSSTDIKHDQAFINMLETCRKNNVGLSSEKLQFKYEKINFY